MVIGVRHGKVSKEMEVEIKPFEPRTNVAGSLWISVQSTDCCIDSHKVGNKEPKSCKNGVYIVRGITSATREIREVTLVSDRGCSNKVVTR